MEENVNIGLNDIVYRRTEVTQWNHIKVRALLLNLLSKQKPDAKFFYKKPSNLLLIECSNKSAAYLR